MFTTELCFFLGILPLMSELGEVRPVLLNCIQNYRRSGDNSASEGELLTEHLRMPNGVQGKTESKEPGEVG